MRIIQFIIALYAKFLPFVGEKEVASLQLELEEDWKTIVTDKEHKNFKDQKHHEIKIKLKRMEENPYFRLALGPLFFIAQKSIHEYIHSEPEKENINED